MAQEFYANLFATTINQVGGINNSSNPVTFTVGTTTGSPSLPYRIVIDLEILLVTAQTGTTMTASRAQESTAIATHSNTANVVHVVTRDGLITQFGGLFSANTWSGAATFNAGVTVGLGFGLTMTGGAGYLAMQGTGDALIIGGTTGITLANNANSVANMHMTDAGAVTFAGGVTAVVGASTPAFTAGSASLLITSPRVVFFDDTSSASYVSYDSSTNTYFRSNGQWVFQSVPAGGTRFSDAGTNVGVLSTGLFRLYGTAGVNCYINTFLSGTSTSYIGTSGGTSQILTGDANGDFAIATLGKILFSPGGLNNLKISIQTNGDLSLPRGTAFWGHSVVAAQPVAPVTLADVIAIIRGCGLSA